MATQTTLSRTVQHAEVAIPELLDQTIERGASDLHITSGSHPIIRVNGA